MSPTRPAAAGDALRLRDVAEEPLRPFPRTGTRPGRLEAALEQLLPGLDEATLRAVVADTHVRTLPRGARLRCESGATTTAALVLTGRLELRDAGRTLRVGPGAVVNARSLLAAPAYPVDGRVPLHAVRPTRVALLPRARLHALARRAPGIASDLLRLTDEELYPGIRPAASDALECESVAVVRLSGDVDERAAARTLSGALAAWATTAQGDVSRVHVSAPRVRGPWTEFVERQELRHRYVVGAVDGSRADDLRTALAEADRVVLLADADFGALDPLVRRTLWQDVERPPGSVHLALLHAPETPHPRSIAWARHALVDVVHNLRGDDPDGFARLARMLAGRASALVLTGADARAWAGLGVLDALANRGRVPDVVCGVGLGAAAARLFATGDSVGDVLGTLQRSTRRFLDLLRPPGPERVRERLDAGLEDRLGDLAMVDCWRPCITLDPGPVGIGIPGSLPALLGRLSVWCAADRVWVVKTRDVDTPPKHRDPARPSRHRTVELALARDSFEDLRAVRAMSRAGRRQAALELTREAQRWRPFD